MEKTQKLKCPICNSDNTEVLLTENGKPFYSSLTHRKYIKCKECSYRGTTGVSRFVKYVMYILGLFYLYCIFIAGPCGALLAYIIPFISLGIFMDDTVIRKARKRIGSRKETAGDSEIS